MRWFALFCVSLLLTACGKPNPNTLVVGTIAGPETELVEVAAKEAQDKYGLRVKIVEFSDYNLPNEALSDGSLDANVFQHQPYLDQASKAQGYQLIAIGKTFVYPTGIYSKKYKALSELPESAIVAIPNDPSNEIRALKLLEAAKLISLKPGSDHNSLDDIDSNPKKLVFKELDAAQLPRILPDVDAAVINTTFAIPAGLSPSRDALFVESKDSPYANIIVSRKEGKKQGQLQKFVKAFQSQAVKDKAYTLFGTDAIVAWSNNDNS